MIAPRPHIAAMAPYALADLGSAELVSLAQNESAFPPSPKALAAAEAAAADLRLYPDPDCTDLRAAIAEVHGLEPAQILCGAGSMELISVLLQAYGGPGSRVFGSEYGYAFVATAAQQVEADYLQVEEVDFRVSVEALLAGVGQGAKILFLCNPGNPTGTALTTAEVRRLRAKLPGKLLLVVDEAYGEFSEEEPLFDLVARGDTVVLRTFSKAYGLAGARVGWGYFPSEIAVQVRKLLNPNNVSLVSQAAAAAAMRDQETMRRTVRETARIRDNFAAGLRRLGLVVPESRTNFVLIGFASAAAAVAADAALRRQGLLLRGMAGYGLPQCLRATIGEEAVMQRCLTVLEEVCHGL